MKFKTIFFLVWITFQTISAYAVESYSCNYNPNNNLVAGSSYGTLFSMSNSQGIASFARVLKSPELNKCDDAAPGPVSVGDLNMRELRFRFNESANIDFSWSVTSEGKTYYGLKGTGSEFLNKYGYIYFKIAREDGANSSPVQSSTHIFQGLSALNQGIQVDSIHIGFFHSSGAPISGPKEEINNISIDLGLLMSSLFVNWSNPDGYIVLSGSQKAYITLNIKPSLAESCSVNSQTVQLPEVPAGNLKSAGEEIGGVSFNVTVRCGSADAGKQLMYTMMDNNAPLNVRSDVLTNTVPETKNVGVAVYDDNGARVITHNTTGVLGILPGGVNPSVSKRFLARYHKLDNLPVKPGVLNAQATILVNYK
ncbi:fimbrial protein [Acinetobacter sp. WC-323]|uniref:fimbrial protein n=1 Tax=Acinetobacter sp. WC-323 TaxID=903918 RepID=UPI00029E347E|nr:fimbrial protein [Acinetobacter sp. WC-323]EKU56587.1 fimbrial protein [Acinetobacter sp. WC-323]